MSTKKETKKEIKCPIFWAQNEAMEKMSNAINETGDIQEKVRLANNLAKEAEKLLFCKNFDKKKIECKICHYIANLRKQIANFILKFKIPKI